MSSPLRSALPWLVGVLAGTGCQTSMVGTSAPTFVGSRWVLPRDQRPPDLSAPAWRLVAVFSPGSGACVAEVPHLVELQQRYGERGLVLAGMTAASEGGALAFQQQHGASYPILAHAEPNLDALGVGSLPTNYLIDPAGVIVAHDLEEIRAILARTMP